MHGEMQSRYEQHVFSTEWHKAGARHGNLRLLAHYAVATSPLLANGEAALADKMTG